MFFGIWQELYSSYRYTSNQWKWYMEAENKLLSKSTRYAQWCIKLPWAKWDENNTKQFGERYVYNYCRENIGLRLGYTCNKLFIPFDVTAIPFNLIKLASILVINTYIH